MCRITKTPVLYINIKLKKAWQSTAATHLDPCEVDSAIDLIDGAFDKSLGQSPHDQELDLVDGDLGLSGDGVETQQPVSRTPPEGHLHQGQEADLVA